MMRYVNYFFQFNYKPILGLLIGSVAGYICWIDFGMNWGTYPLSSECWVNCVCGSLFGGLIGSLLSEK